MTQDPDHEMDLAQLDPLDELDHDPFVLPTEEPLADDLFAPPDAALAAAIDECAPDFRAAIETHVDSGGRSSGVPVPVDSYTAMVGGRHHGLGRWETGVDERQHWVPLTSWLAYRERQRSVHAVDAHGRLTAAPTITHDVRLVDARGSSWLVRDVPATDSASPRVVDLAAAPLAVPHDPAKRGAVSNMIRLLGSSTMPVERSVASTGWVLGLDEQHPNRPIYLAPSASVTPDGIDPDPQIAPPPGSSGGLTGVMAHYGFGGADSPPDEAVGAIRLFLDIVPHRPEVGIALLGALWSAPLGLATRPVVVVEGQTDSGKTLLCTALVTFVASITPGDRQAPLFSFQGTSEAGARARLGWARDTLVLADDYRRDGDNPRANEQADRLLATLAQLGYGAGTGAKATVSGGARETPDVRATVVISAETAPVESAIRNRVCVVHVDQSDGVTFRGGGYDAFRDQAGILPRSLMADYTRWLAERIEAHAGKRGGGLAFLAQRADDDARAFYLAADGRRAAESVAGLAAGWTMFRRYAVARGIACGLPSEEAVATALTTLVEINAAAATEVDPATRLVETIRDSVASAAGHLVDTRSRQPRVASPTGWVVESSVGPRGGTLSHRPCGPALGVLTDDYKSVFLTASHLRVAARLAGLSGLHPDQLHRAMASLHNGDTAPGGRVPESAIPSRPKGWLIPIGLILADPSYVSDDDLAERRGG